MAEHLDLVEADPRDAASQLLDADPDGPWLDAFMAELSIGRASSQLGEVLEVWDLSQAEFGALIGVSRQAVSKWLDHLPADRAVIVADLAAATQLLVHYVRRERIPAVVRRPSVALEGRSFLDLIRNGESAMILDACRVMFDPAQAVG